MKLKETTEMRKKINFFILCHCVAAAADVERVWRGENSIFDKVFLFCCNMNSRILRLFLVVTII